MTHSQQNAASVLINMGLRRVGVSYALCCVRFCNGYHCASEIPMNDEGRPAIHNSQTSLLLHGLITSYRTRKLAVATTPTSRQQSTYCRYSDDNVTAGRYFHNARLITPDYSILKDCELECGNDGRPAEYRWRLLFNAAKFG